MRVELAVVGLLRKKKELTINQISKQLGESYAFVHRKVKELVQQNVIFTKTIGHSSLCFLNKDSDRLKALLYVHEVERKEVFLTKKSTHKVIEQNLKLLPINCSIIHPQSMKVILVSTKKINKDLLKNLKKQGLSTVVVSPERFSSCHEELLSNHYIIIHGFCFVIDKLLT